MKSFARKLKSTKFFGPHRLGPLAFISALTLLASNANAGGWFTASISTLYVDVNGTIQVNFNTNSACGSARLQYVHSVIGNDDAKAMLAALLAWQAQSMQVSVYVTNCLATYGDFEAAYAGN